MKRFCLTLDLINDADLIKEYEDLHKEIWPDIRDSILNAGISNMEIFRLQTRLCMIMETDDAFTFERKKLIDEQNEIVQRWETMLWKFQKPIDGSAPGEKWQLMEQIFTLNSD